MVGEAAPLELLLDADALGALIVPLHRELKRGTLAGILRDAGMDPNDVRRLP